MIFTFAVVTSKLLILARLQRNIKTVTYNLFDLREGEEMDKAALHIFLRQFTSE